MSAELIADAQRGRRLRYHGEPPSKELAERMLEIPTGLILDARARNAGLAALELERELERLEHDWVPYRGLTIHLESHHVDPAAATFVIVPGLGDHSRRQLALATALAARGHNALVLDRQGHGLSEGRRGDAPLESDLGLIELAIALARRRSSGPVVVVGDSLGGIMTWYLLTREPDLDAAICHCISHPDVHHDPAFRRKAPIMRTLARVAPYAPIPLRQIADYDNVALDPETRRYFDEQIDRLFNFRVTARSAASYIGFEPAIAWERVQVPVLVMIGAADAMVTPRFTRRSLERARPPRAEYLEIEGAGHQLFLDDIGLAIEPLTEWVEPLLARRDAPATTG